MGGYFSFSGGASAKGLIAGPFRILPSGANREPWHGQSQLVSVAFHETMHPRCVHTAERSCSLPLPSRYAAIFERPRRMIAPLPG